MKGLIKGLSAIYIIVNIVLVFISFYTMSLSFAQKNILLLIISVFVIVSSIGSIIDYLVDNLTNEVDNITNSQEDFAVGTLGRVVVSIPIDKDIKEEDIDKELHKVKNEIMEYVKEHEQV